MTLASLYHRIKPCFSLAAAAQGSVRVEDLPGPDFGLDLARRCRRDADGFISRAMAGGPSL